MVDKGIAVMLVVVVNGVVTVDFLLTDRVLLVPTKQQLYGPRLDFRFGSHITRTPTAILSIVAYAHIHEGTGKIAFILIDGLEDCPRKARGLASAQLRSIARSPRGRANFAVCIVVAATVHIAVGREDVMQVGARRGLVVEPALRPRVLTVVARAFSSIVATLVLAKMIDVGRRAVRVVGIHIPKLEVGRVILKQFPDLAAGVLYFV